MTWSTQRLRLAQRLHAALAEYKAFAEAALQAAECDAQSKQDVALLQRAIAAGCESLSGAWPREIVEVAIRETKASVPQQPDTSGLAKRARQLAADAERADASGLCDEAAFVPEAGVVSWAALCGCISQWARELEHDPAPNPSVLSFFDFQGSESLSPQDIATDLRVPSCTTVKTKGSSQRKVRTAKQSRTKKRRENSDSKRSPTCKRSPVKEPNRAAAQTYFPRIASSLMSLMERADMPAPQIALVRERLDALWNELSACSQTPSAEQPDPYMRQIFSSEVGSSAFPTSIRSESEKEESGLIHMSFDGDSSDLF